MSTEREPPKEPTDLEGQSRVRDLLETLPATLKAAANRATAAELAAADPVPAARERYQHHLDQLLLLSGELEGSREASALFRTGYPELGYYAHASTQLATRVAEIAQTALPPTVPDAETLELLAASCPQDPATLLFARGLSAFEMSASLFESTYVRLRALLAESAGEETRHGRLLGSALVLLALEKYVRPGLKALEAVDGRGLGVTARSWGVGPWEVLAVAVLDLQETERCLRIAWGALSTAEMASQLGAEFSLEVNRTLEELEATTRHLVVARDRMKRRSLRGLTGSTRLTLRLESIARQAGRWHEELANTTRDLARYGEAEADDEATALSAWLETELAGPLGAALAQVMATASQAKNGDLSSSTTVRKTS